MVAYRQVSMDTMTETCGHHTVKTCTAQHSTQQQPPKVTVAKPSSLSKEGMQLQSRSSNSMQVTSVPSSTPADNSKVIHLFPPLPKPYLPVGGCLKYFKSEWYRHTHYPMIIEMISACPLELNKIPSQVAPQRENQMSKIEKAAAREHIQDLLTKRAIVRCSHSDGVFVSSVFLCPKKNGCWHMILDLKNFNTFATKTKFKMETLKHILHLVQPRMWMSSIDLQDKFLAPPGLLMFHL